MRFDRHLPAVKAAVVLLGAAGVGKTTLARTVTASLRSPVRWVACTESSRSIPLGAMAHLVSPSTSRDPIALILGAGIPRRPRGHRRRRRLRSCWTNYRRHCCIRSRSSGPDAYSVNHPQRRTGARRGHRPVADGPCSDWNCARSRKEQSIALVGSVLGRTLEGLSADIMWAIWAGTHYFCGIWSRGHSTRNVNPGKRCMAGYADGLSSSPVWPRCCKVGSMSRQRCGQRLEAVGAVWNRSISTHSANWPVRTPSMRPRREA